MLTRVGDAGRYRGARLFAAISAVLVCVVVAVAPAPRAAGTPPPNPSDQQIKNAQAAKDATATQIGELAARIAQAEAQINRLDAAAELAEQRLALALQRVQQATQQAATAKAAADAAQRSITAARAQFSAFVHAAYLTGPVNGTAAGALLTATDPNTLLQRVDDTRFASEHQLDLVSQLDRRTVDKSNADAATRAALDARRLAAAAALTAQANVVTALAAARSQKAILDGDLSTYRAQLQAAQIKLTGLTDQRVAYRAWQVQQAAIAAAAAARRRAEQLAQQQAAAANAARLAAAAAAAASANQNGPAGGGSSGTPGGGSGSGGGGFSASGGGSSTPAPGGGGWTAAKGQDAVNRVMGFLGMPYAFAGGNADGPTYGICEPGDAFNDCHVYGFDCSGLTIYAWAPWLSMDHFAATQYDQVGSYHPSTGDLMPGDLVFWSGDGTVAGIGHVAMYIGGGNVIQAPQSGDVIKITNLFNVENGYYGATRPLT